MRLLFTPIFLLVLFSGFADAQSEYQPYSYLFYLKLNSDINNTQSRAHTSLKPFFVDDSLVKQHYDALMGLGADSGKHTWVHRKLFFVFFFVVWFFVFFFFVVFLFVLFFGLV